jgi:hypothetical protein
MSAALKKPVAGHLPPLYVGFKKKYRRPDDSLSPGASAAIEYATEYLKLDEDESFMDMKGVRWGGNLYDIASDRAYDFTYKLSKGRSKKVREEVEADMDKWQGDYIEWLKEMS